MPAQERRLRFARPAPDIGKAIAEIGHRELEPLGQRLGAGERLRQIRKQPRHRLGRFQIPLGVAVSRRPARGERRLVTKAGEHVDRAAAPRAGEPHAVGGHHRHAKRRGQIDQRLRCRPVRRAEMPLQLDADVAASEHADEPIDESADADAARPRSACRPTSAISPAVQPSKSSSVKRDFAFRRAQLRRVITRQRFR